MSDSEPAGARGMRVWWGALSIRSRERVLLGALVGLAVATRDALLLTFAAGLFGLLELNDVPANRAATPAS